MDKNVIALIGLLIEGSGFVIIWFLGGMDGALAKLRAGKISIESNLKRLQEIKELFQKNVLSQVMSTSSLGAPVMGFVLPNTQLNMYLDGLINQEQSLLDQTNADIEKRRFRRLFEASKGTALGFFLVLLGLFFQCKAIYM